VKKTPRQLIEERRDLEEKLLKETRGETRKTKYSKPPGWRGRGLRIPSSRQIAASVSAETKKKVSARSVRRDLRRRLGPRATVVCHMRESKRQRIRRQRLAQLRESELGTW